MDVYVGLDLGTTGMKAVAMDAQMNLLASASCASPMMGGGPLREFDADDFCERAFGLLRKVAEQCGGGVKAVSAASASGNTVFLDGGMKPLMNAISWTDARVKGREGEYLPGFGFETVHPVTGWPYVGMFPLAHIALVKRDRPEVFRNAAMVCMSTEYLLYRLCGKWGLDHSDATTFYLQDQVARAYHKPYLDYFEIGEDILPPLYPPGYALGTVTPEAARATGIAEGAKVVLGSFDHPSCARGMGALKEGDLLLSCGTSWAGLYVSKERDKAIRAGMLVDPFRVKRDGLWACMFALTQYGESIDARIGAYIDDSPRKFETFNALAERVKARRTIVCDLADGAACGEAWQSASKEEIAWSVMYSACVEAASRIREMEPYGFMAERVYMAGGPASSARWPQVMADVTGRPIYCLHRQFGGAVGAAMMAAEGDGLVDDVKEFFQNEARYTVYSPGGEENG